jgi:orotate phosphoribosyltransferase
MDVITALERAGAVLQDFHFVYASSKHGSAYIDLDSILPDISTISTFCRAMATPFAGEVDVVAAPATGAIVLSVLVAKSLAQNSKVDAIWADKRGSDFVFERAGFTKRLEGRRLLVVEDLLTTGGSVAKVCQQARRHGAQIVGVSVVCNRGSVTAQALDVPRLEALATVSLDAVEEQTCPLCAQQVPIVEDVGHGAEFRARTPAYPGGFIQLSRNGNRLTL